jgi:integrase
MNKPQSITNETAKKIILQMDIRDKCITQIMIDTGLRITDTLNLRKNDIKCGIIRQRKTKKLKKITLSDKTRQILDNYIEWYYINDLLFPQQRDKTKAIHRSTFYRALNRVSREIGVIVSPHSFRKLYAQNIYTTTQDIHATQKALQHKYIATTAAYLDIELEAMLKPQTVAGMSRWARIKHILSKLFRR